MLPLFLHFQLQMLFKICLVTFLQLKVCLVWFLTCRNMLSFRPSFCQSRLQTVKLSFNSLTPVPTVTGRAKTHPQFPVLATTLPFLPSLKTVWFSYWSIVGTNKSMRMDFWGVLERRFFFVLKSHTWKVQEIMLHCEPSQQTSMVLFSCLKRTNCFFVT